MTQLKNKEWFTEMVGDRPAITWSWLAGFYQAEGSISYNPTYSSHNLSIGQKGREILDRIRGFLGFGSIYPMAPKDCYLYSCSKRANTKIIADSILPHLIGGKWTTMISKCQEMDIDIIDAVVSPQKELDWDFVTGFWEGDGSISINDSYFRKTGGGRPYAQIVFAQLDPEVLHKIKDFLGPPGSIQPDREYYKLVVGDLREELLKHARTLERRTQLTVSLASSSKLRGVEGYRGSYDV